MNGNDNATADNGNVAAGSDLPAGGGVDVGGSGIATATANQITFHFDTPDIRDLVAGSVAPVKVKERFWSRSSPRKELKRKLDKALGQAPDDAMGVLLSLIADCDLRAYDARRASKRWSGAYYMLGLPAAVLATIAGAAGLASTAGRIPAAIIALVAAGLATAATFLNSNENKQQSNKLGAAWQELADDVRIVVISNSQEPTKNDKFSKDSLIREVFQFNRRKNALLRGDLSPTSETLVQPPSRMMQG